MILSNGIMTVFEITDIEIAANSLDKDSISFFIAAVIWVPLLETLLFQKIPYVLLTKLSFFNKRVILIYIISATLFASTHFYSVAYIVYTFIVGLGLIHAYHLRVGKQPFWTVVAIHSLFNLTICIIEKLQIFEDI